jgi:Ankyrin repeats (3 copies)
MAPLNELSLALVVSDWEKATAIAKNTPSQAALWTKRVGLFEGVVKPSYCLPLHEVVCSSSTSTAPPLETVAAILAAHGAAVRTRESAYGRLPLHCACRRPMGSSSASTNNNSKNNDTSANHHHPHYAAAVIALLLRAHPAACLVPDDLGRLPLHYALSNNNGADATIVHMLLSASPESARGVDAASWTPLHVACANAGSTTTASIGIVQALLHLHPAAAIWRTDKGSTPSQCLSATARDRDAIRQALKEARRAFDATFVNPLANPRILVLADNTDAVLV